MSGTEANAKEPRVFELVVRDSRGGEVGTCRVDGASLGTTVRPALLKQAAVAYQANRRVGTASTRTRAEISGSGRKPWRQKGTGRARAGTRKSPIWRGGGVVFGPHPRDYSQGLNRRQKRLATRSALLGKLIDNEVKVVDELALAEPKTKLLAGILKSQGIHGSCLIGVTKPDRALRLSARNLPRVSVAPVEEFNAYELLRHETVLLTREALEFLAEPLGKRRGRTP